MLMNIKNIQLLLFLLLSFSMTAQQIVSGEYFFDTAPNQGAGIPISFTANSAVNHSMSIPTTGLNSGIHQLYVRVKNDANIWSHYQKRMIFVIEPIVINNTQIVAAEWFIDVDPGVGNGTDLSVTTGNTVSGALSIPNAMSPGIHHLYIRVKNNLGKWGHHHKSMFYVIAPLIANNTTIVKGEYFFDIDPGVGNALQINVNAGNNINQNMNISAAGLTPGIHNLFIRVKNNNGIWGHYQRRMLFITDQNLIENKTIVAAEYFLDNDPGLALGTPITITPGTNLMEDFDLNTSSVLSGVHYLYIRVKEDNGRWSHYAKHKFLICNDVLASPIVSGNSSVCGNSDLLLEGSTIPNATDYFWTGPNGFSQTGNFLTISNVDVNTVGLYTFFAVRAGSSACDTAYTEVNVQVLPTSSSVNMQSICAGETYQINGNSYTNAGFYYDTLTGQNGCDSIIETQLTVFSTYEVDNYQTICNGESYSINGNTYTTSGTYFDIYPTQNGCDSTIITYLTVNPSYSSNNPQTICQGESYQINGNSYVSTGTYIDIVASVSGCDSVITTILTVNDPILNANVAISGNTLTSLENNATYQWIDCLNGNIAIPNETNQSFTATINGEYAVQLTELMCFTSETSSCFAIDNLNLNEFVISKKIEIYPSPAKDQFTIQSNSIELDNLSVYNLEGKLVYSSEAKFKVKTIEIDSWSEGLYLIKISSSNEINFFKIVIE